MGNKRKSKEITDNKTHKDKQNNFKKKQEIKLNKKALQAKCTLQSQMELEHTIKLTKKEKRVKKANKQEEESEEHILKQNQLLPAKSNTDNKLKKCQSNSFAVEEDITPEKMGKIPKKKKKISEITFKEGGQQSVSEKPKKTFFENEEKTLTMEAIEKSEVITPQDTNIETSKKKKRILNTDNTKMSCSERPKKIVFDDDDKPKSVSTSSNTDQQNHKTFLNEEETKVTKEEIDEFCDELDEEDNVVYNNWIKLLEAKLHPNKKH